MSFGDTAAAFKPVKLLQYKLEKEVGLGVEPVVLRVESVVLGVEPVVLGVEPVLENTP